MPRLLRSKRSRELYLKIMQGYLVKPKEKEGDKAKDAEKNVSRLPDSSVLSELRQLVALKHTPQVIQAKRDQLTEKLTGLKAQKGNLEAVEPRTKTLTDMIEALGRQIEKVQSDLQYLQQVEGDAVEARRNLTAEQDCNHVVEDYETLQELLNFNLKNGVKNFYESPLAPDNLLRLERLHRNNPEALKTAIDDKIANPNNLSLGDELGTSFLGARIFWDRSNAADFEKYATGLTTKFSEKYLAQSLAPQQPEAKAAMLDLALDVVEFFQKNPNPLIDANGLDSNQDSETVKRNLLQQAYAVLNKDNGDDFQKTSLQQLRLGLLQNALGPKNENEPGPQASVLRLNPSTTTLEDMRKALDDLKPCLNFEALAEGEAQDAPADGQAQDAPQVLSLSEMKTYSKVLTECLAQAEEKESLAPGTSSMAEKYLLSEAMAQQQKLIPILYAVRANLPVEEKLELSRACQFQARALDRVNGASDALSENDSSVKKQHSKEVKILLEQARVLGQPGKVDNKKIRECLGQMRQTADFKDAYTIAVNLVAGRYRDDAGHKVKPGPEAKIATWLELMERLNVLIKAGKPHVVVPGVKNKMSVENMGQFLRNLAASALKVGISNKLGLTPEMCRAITLSLQHTTAHDKIVDRLADIKRLGIWEILAKPDASISVEGQRDRLLMLEEVRKKLETLPEEGHSKAEIAQLNRRKEGLKSAQAVIKKSLCDLYRHANPKFLTVAKCRELITGLSNLDGSSTPEAILNHFKQLEQDGVFRALRQNDNTLSLEDLDARKSLCEGLIGKLRLLVDASPERAQLSEQVNAAKTWIGERLAAQGANDTGRGHGNGNEGTPEAQG